VGYSRHLRDQVRAAGCERKNSVNMNARVFSSPMRMPRVYAARVNHRECI
jgi:hypothetical protein